MNLVDLVCLQLSLHTLLWAFGAMAFKEERAATLHWFGYAAAAALATWLMSLRAGHPGWLSGPGATLTYFLSLMLAARGVAVFLRLRPRDRENLAMLALALAGLAWMGASPDTAWQRSALMSSLSVALMLLTIWHCWKPIHQEFGLVLAVPAALSALAMTALHTAQVVRAWQQADVLRAASLDVSAIPAPTWVLLLLSAASFNYLFLFLVALRLVNTLRTQARRDPLTGLLNRRAMTHALASEWLRHAQGGPPFTLIGVDLDHFKRVNDEHGHGAGDEVLRCVAARLQSALRAGDRLGRMGGEELLVLLPACVAEHAGREAAERMRLALVSEPVPLSAGPQLSVTASFGVSGVRPGDANVEQVEKRADAALYEAKATGRDRIVLA